MQARGAPAAACEVAKRPIGGQDKLLFLSRAIIPSRNWRRWQREMWNPMTDTKLLYEQMCHAFNQRNWLRALDLAGRCRDLAPREPSVYYIAGISSLEIQNIQQALGCLKMATRLAPERADYGAALARAFTFANLFRDAQAAADSAWKLNPADAITLDTLGVVYSQVGAYETAVDVFKKVVSLTPGHAPYRYNLATSLVAAGQLDQAEAEIEACLKLDPRYWRAHLTVAQLRRQTQDSNHVERLTKLLDSVGDATADSSPLVWLNMALAKEHEDLGNYPKALDYLVAGKAVGGSSRGYSANRDAAIFDAIKRSFPRERQSRPKGHATSEPLFVMGMPRTGTTLVERIISSHPDVQSAGELLNFAMSIKQMSGTTSSSVIDVETLARARDLDRERLGQMYVSSTRPGTGQRPHFLDKLPHNFLYAGWISEALPNARMICLRRNPMDTCLSNFRQLFAPKSPYFDYSFDLLDTGRYYLLFNDLMAYWQEAFPGRILEVRYEELVDNQETISRKIIEFCGLTWNEACLRFEDNPSAVATASAVQVRAPIYRSALRRWEKYGSRLQPLKELLEAGGVDVGT